MNLALVILHADPAKGGAETYTCDLAAALAARGHRVSVLAASFSAAVDGRCARVPLAMTGPTRLARYLRFLAALDAHLAANAAGPAADRYDVVHAMLPVRRCDLYHPHAGIAAEAVATGHAKYRSPIKQSIARLANRLNRKRQRFAAVERELLMPHGQAEAGGPVALCLSDYVKAAVRKHYPLPGDRLPTLINAVDLAKFDPAAAAEAGRATRAKLGIAPDKVVGLIVAQDFARKGLREAVEAWRRIDDERLVLLVVGKDDFAPYAKLAEGSRFPKNLVYAGATRDVRPFYATADFFVLPTRHDPCSLVVLEALAMGLPVVSTRFNGACEVMTDGVHGRVLPDPADVGAVAAAMREALDEPKLNAMKAACLALRPRLSYDFHLDGLEAVYREVRRPATSD
ncbi:MAG TPA: glycosyltransferase family 4 protein [Humisphaera sp.]